MVQVLEMERTARSDLRLVEQQPPAEVQPVQVVQVPRCLAAMQLVLATVRLLEERESFQVK